MTHNLKKKRVGVSAGFQPLILRANIQIVGAHRDGRPFLVRADEILIAFLELE